MMTNSRVFVLLILLSSGCMTPLQKAARHGENDTIQSLLAKGADINAAPHQGLTPLMWASYFGQEKTVSLLVDKGADVGAKDESRRTALWYAATRGHLGVVKLLASRTSDLSALDIEGKTVLQAAFDSGRMDVVEYLRSVASWMTGIYQPNTTAAPMAKFSGQSRISDVDVPQRTLPARPHDYALIVGVDKYKSLPDAQYAARDAEAVRRHVEALGFPPRNIIYLVGENATRGALEAYLSEWLPKNVKPESTVLFYFSGHGAPDPNQGETYLIPWDGDANFVRSTGYATKDLYKRVQKLGAANVIVALDACFSGAGGRSVLPPGARPIVMSLTEPAPSANVALLAAASGSEITSVIEDQGHGSFTYYFLKGLSGAAADENGNVSPSSLYWYLKPLVQQEAHRQNREQTPMLAGDTRDKVFVRWGSGSH